MYRERVIIIGGGLGGLMSGALLAKEGFEVSLFEKHHNIGGGLQSYTRFGAIFDTGMHVFGGLHEGGNIRRICEHLGIMERFVYQDVDSSAGLKLYVESAGRSYDIDLGREGLVRSLSDYFPGEAAELANYVSSLDAIVGELDLYHLRKVTHGVFEHSEKYDMPASKLLDRYFRDERLKSVVACVNSLYAGEKDITPSYLHAAISMMLLNGASRVAGGYSNFANALVEVIEKHGGTVSTGCEVKEIKTHEGRFQGVRLANGDEAVADYCISSAPPTVTIDLLDNAKVFSKAYRNHVAQRRDSLSAFIVNIKLKEGMQRYSNKIGFYYKDYNVAWKASDGTCIEKFMYMTPPMVEQGEWAATLNVSALMKWDAVARWENTRRGERGGDYREWKERLCRDVIESLEHVIPGFADMIDGIDSASPLTIRDYTAVRHGAMCGSRKESGNLFDSFLSVRTKVPNLLLTGQSNNMHGFCGVSLTAVQTVGAILGEDYISQIGKKEHKL